MSKQKFDELGNLADPIIRWLNKNFDQHTIIVIQNDRVDLYRGEMGSSLCYYNPLKSSEE